jgi:TusA-related sulfurtransferase
MADMKAFSEQTGHELLSAGQDGSLYTFFLKKR